MCKPKYINTDLYNLVNKVHVTVIKVVENQSHVPLKKENNLSEYDLLKNKHRPLVLHFCPSPISCCSRRTVFSRKKTL